MTVAINQRQPQESGFDKILKGLTAARALTGVAVDYTSLKKYYDEKNARENNVVAGKDLIEYADKGSFSDSQTPGSVPIGIQTSEGIQQKFFTGKDKRPGALSQLEYAKTRGDGFNEVPAGTKGSILVSHLGPNGEVVQSTLLPPDKASKATPDQSKAALFGKRMQQAEDVFSELGNKGFDATTLGASAQRSILFPENFKGASNKSQDQAERNFVNAVLRRESGSAISPSEFSSAEKQYFPRAGDPPEVLKQKAENRALAIQGMQSESGPAWNGISIAKAKSSVEGSSKANKSSLIPEAQAGALRPGAIQDGYLFKGGNPADQKNWQKVGK